MERSRGALHLKPKREKPIKNHHPWIFSGAIRRTEGTPEAGALVDVISADGTWLALAHFNPHSQIRARILTWNSDEQVTETWWRRRLQDAFRVRTRLQLDECSQAYRLVNAEADLLPGLVVDRYENYLVIQALTVGIERHKEMITGILRELLQPDAIIERSDVEVRKKEGLSPEKGMLYGRAPDSDFSIKEYGYEFSVDLLSGQKTGLYLDQRENRRFVGQSRFVQGRDVLNVFAYTGGFSLYAVGGGARAVTSIDSSETFLQEARHNVERNFGERPQDSYVTGDAFTLLRQYRDTDRRFDLVLLDPPKFAHSQRDVQNAARGYKDLNWLAFRLLRPGGFLATFSCSGLVSAELFQKIVFSAVADAGRDAQILFTLSQAPDHPILLTFPESAYLKGLFVRVI